MTTEPKEKPQELCSIKIMFPVETDEQAIQYKQAIGSVLATIPNAKVEFTLLSFPSYIGKINNNSQPDS